jgi:multidrug efflux pump
VKISQKLSKTKYTFLLFYPGNSAEDVEKLIIKPLEKEIKNISGVTKVTSSSFQDYGMIIAEFEDKVPIIDAKQKIKDKVDNSKADTDWPIWTTVAR